jgi:hypothetical protein
VRKTIVTLVAALGLLVAVTSASAAVIVGQGTTAPGTTSLSFNSTNTTTAYALGVWTSSTTLVPIAISGNVDCVHNANDRVFSGTLFASRTLSDAAFLWFGSRGIAGPWLGWDTCSIHVNVNAPSLGSDNRMIAWLASHQ